MSELSQKCGCNGSTGVIGCADSDVISVNITSKIFLLLT